MKKEDLIEVLDLTSDFIIQVYEGDLLDPFDLSLDVEFSIPLTLIDMGCDEQGIEF